jgi:DNA replication protein DnaC
MNKLCPHCDIEMELHSIKQAEECWALYKSAETIEITTSELIARCDVSNQFGKQTFVKSDKDIMDKNRGAWDTAQGWLKSDATCLYLHGAPGTGKTYAARCVLYDAMSSITQSRPYVSVIEISAYKMLKHASNFGPVADYLNVCLELVDYLMIDDIDKPDWNPKHIAFLWNLLNERSNRGGRVIITTNVEPDKFRGIFSGAAVENTSRIDATIERLHPVTVAHFEGETLRRMAL